jgi:hypothetical protein
MRQLNDVVNSFERALEHNPEVWWLNAPLVSACALLQHKQEAREAFAKQGLIASSIFLSTPIFALQDFMMLKRLENAAAREKGPTFINLRRLLSSMTLMGLYDLTVKIEGIRC